MFSSEVCILPIPASSYLLNDTIYVVNCGFDNGCNNNFSNFSLIIILSVLCLDGLPSNLSILILNVHLQKCHLVSSSMMMSIYSQPFRVKVT